MNQGELLTAIHEEVKSLSATLLGNGGEGLVTRHARLEERVRAVERTGRRWRDAVPSIVSGVAVAIVVAAIFAWVK